MAFSNFIEALHSTGRMPDKAFAGLAAVYRKLRGGDIPLKEKAGDIIRPSSEAKRALEKRYGKNNVIYVEVRQETLAQFETRTGVKSYLYGKKAEAAANFPTMNAEVAVILPDPIPKKTYWEPFARQQDILVEENRPIKGFTFTHPLTPVDAANIGQAVFAQTGINILERYTRVGKDGSLIVGRLLPGVRVGVHDDFLPDQPGGHVGLLFLGVPTQAIGR